MDRQSEPEDTLTRPHTCTHTFISLDAINIQMRKWREASDGAPEPLLKLRPGNSFLPLESTVDDGDSWSLPGWKNGHHKVVCIVQLDVGKLTEGVKSRSNWTIDYSVEVVVLPYGFCCCCAARNLLGCFYSI